MADPYLDREQTKAKHFILRRYLQALAFKVLGFSDITYGHLAKSRWPGSGESDSLPA
jgi:hypothetical protein